jgi:phosphoenolpyruvate synthase/pyruvate phosphate dikinase
VTTGATGAGVAIKGGAGRVSGVVVIGGELGITGVVDEQAARAVARVAASAVRKG